MKSHLSTSDEILWVFLPFLSGTTITNTPMSFTVTLTSTKPEMMVYVLGKGSEEFDIRVPPTNPGFVLSELSTLIMALAPLTALALYTVSHIKNVKKAEGNQFFIAI